LDISVRVKNASEIGNFSRTIQELAHRRKSFAGNKLRAFHSQKCISPLERICPEETKSERFALERVL